MILKQLKSAFTISFFTLISRIFGFIRDVLIAKYIGVNYLSDIFFAAFRLPNFFRRIFAEGAFNNAFVPIFSGKLETNNDQAIKFAKNILSFLFFSLLILIILMQIFMPVIIKIIFPGFNDKILELNLAINLSRITIFYLLFISIVSLFSAILNSLGKFASPAATPIILNITFIIFLIFLGDYFPNLSYALSFAVFFAGILQLFWILFFSIRNKILIYPTWPKFNEDIKIFLKKILPGIIGANVMQINLLIDTAIASLFAGGISYIYYADRVNQLPLALIGIALSVTLLPTLSKKIQNQDFQQANNLHNKILEIAFLIAIPASIGLCFLSMDIISILFQRDNFTAIESSCVAKALMIYALGLPGFIMVKIMEPGFFARKDTKTPMKIAIICLISNLILNLIFIKFFAYLGVVLASIISSYINLFLLTFILIKRKHIILQKSFFINIFITIFAAVIMLLFLAFFWNLLQNYNFYSWLKLLIIIISTILIYFTSYFSSKLFIFKFIR